MLRPYIKKIMPHVGLEDYIECYIFRHIRFTKKNNEFEHSFLPTHRQLMLVDLDEEVSLKKWHDTQFVKRGAVTIPGIHLRKVSIRFESCSHRYLCVLFRPGGMYRLLGLPVHAMVNKDFDGSELFGKLSDDLVASLKKANDIKKMKVYLDCFFLSFRRLSRSEHIVDVVLNNIEAEHYSTGRSREILTHTNICVRQLERVFKERLGIPPKTYLRLMRFSNAQNLKLQFPNMSWTEIAHEVGYFDQAHMIKEFKDFAGVSPSAMETNTSRDLFMLPFSS